MLLVLLLGLDSLPDGYFPIALLPLLHTFTRHSLVHTPPLLFTYAHLLPLHRRIPVTCPSHYYTAHALALYLVFDVHLTSDVIHCSALTFVGHSVVVPHSPPYIFFFFLHSFNLLLFLLLYCVCVCVCVCVYYCVCVCVCIVCVCVCVCVCVLAYIVVDGACLVLYDVKLCALWTVVIPVESPPLPKIRLRFVVIRDAVIRIPVVLITVLVMPCPSIPNTARYVTPLTSLRITIKHRV